MNPRLRINGSPIAGLCAGCLALSSVACSPRGAVRAEDSSRSTERTAHQTIDAVLADYESAQSALLAASRHGAKAHVSLLAGNGAVHSGYDVFYSAPEPKILEVRDTGTAMQVGATVCWKAEGRSLFECRPNSSLRIGLFEAPRSRVVKAWSAETTCTEANVPCRFLKLRLLAEPDAETGTVPGQEDADLVGHDYEVLVTLPDHRPVYLRQINRTGIGTSGMALFRFVFDEPVAPFELPSETERARKPDDR